MKKKDSNTGVLDSNTIGRGKSSKQFGKCQNREKGQGKCRKINLAKINMTLHCLFHSSLKRLGQTNNLQIF